MMVVTHHAILRTPNLSHAFIGLEAMGTLKAQNFAWLIIQNRVWTRIG
jgi:hypothetical protein